MKKILKSLIYCSCFTILFISCNNKHDDMIGKESFTAKHIIREYVRPVAGSIEVDKIMNDSWRISCVPYGDNSMVNYINIENNLSEYKTLASAHNDEGKVTYTLSVYPPLRLFYNLKKITILEKTQTGLIPASNRFHITFFSCKNVMNVANSSKVLDSKGHIINEFPSEKTFEDIEQVPTDDYNWMTSSIKLKLKSDYSPDKFSRKYYVLRWTLQDGTLVETEFE